MHKIAFIGNFIPRRCGIATFTHDLYSAIAGQHPTCECSVVAMDDLSGGYDYPAAVRFQIAQDDRDAYRRAAEFLNYNNYDVVSLQHEFGIFGGPAGSYLLPLLRELRMPIVTTLHTVLREPNADQRRVMKQLAEISARLTVMSQRGQAFLKDIYGIPAEKIDVIQHGIPDMPFVDPNFFKDQFGVEGKQVLLTFGLLSPNKGIEYVIRALPAILSHFPNLVYIVVGATHPHLVREQGESYRESLQQLALALGVREHVLFFDRFVELNELLEFIGAADVYITPYLNPAQITSGTLVYSFGCGKAVISTPYWHAEELLADGRGVLVPFADAEQIAQETISLLRDETRRHAMRKRAYLTGREMVWPRVAEQFWQSFARARRPVPAAGRSHRERIVEQASRELPQLALDHLWHMTDDVGMLQHATFTIPNRREGYCTDDNARALVLCVLLEELGMDAPAGTRALATYASFLDHAIQPLSGRCRNFLGYDRQWLEDVGSDDALGRTAWALGTCIGRSLRRDFQFWAVNLFEQTIRACVETTSPRCWAHALLGIQEYLRRLQGDRLMNGIRQTLLGRLVDLFQANADEQWQWFENVLTYENAKLPQALIVSGHSAGDDRALRIGLESLHWLVELQRAPQGWFRPIGNCGFCSRGDTPAAFDQQPLEAYATSSACLAAHQVTSQGYWFTEARRAFDWFLGQNDLRLPLYDATTGGCRDGLLQDRVSQNQGAESTLAFLLALAEFKLLDATAPVHSPSGLEMMAPKRWPMATN